MYDLSLSEDEERIRKLVVCTLKLREDRAEISGARQILGEMIDNLCENAIKYHVEGQIGSTFLVRFRKESL